MLICSVCGKLNNEGSRNCDLCGAPLAGADRQSVAAPSSLNGNTNGGSGEPSGPICPKCRRPNRSVSVFCAFCGYRLKGGNEAQPYVLPNTSNAPIEVHQAQGHNPTAPIASDEAGNIPAGTLLKRRYRILRKIAQGGMGAVYEATDTHAPNGTRWAVKEMSPAALPVSERTQAIADFRREAQMLASLHHPNLPTVVETFEELGKNFLVMEFVPGRTLQSVLDSTPGFLPEERVRVWAHQICDVINYLHSQDPPIIYRDIKPANIMLLENTERIKLIDFGIARFHKAGKSHDTEAFGTAGYAPPEQYGKGQTDQRSDIYALAATLHYLLTKHDPGLNPFNWLPVRQYNQGLSANIESALQTALNLDPQRRFSSIVDFALSAGLARPGELERPHIATSAAPAPPAPVPTNAEPHAVETSQSKPAPEAASAPVSASPAKPKSSAAPARERAPRQKSQSAPVRPAATRPPGSITVVPAHSQVPAPAMPVAAASAATAAPVQAPVKEPPRNIPEQKQVPRVPVAPVVVDHGTTSTGQSHNTAPALMVSDNMVDLGEVSWNSKTFRKVSLLNVGGGEMQGTVVAKEPWMALNIQNFSGNAQTIEVRVKKRRLPLGRVELHVPNLFAIIWARARWALPLIGFWMWVLLLMASSLGQKLLWGLLAVVGVLAVSEVLMWWSAWHVRMLVPAAKINTGRLLVKSSGGEQQIEVRAKARPSGLRVAAGWALAIGLMTAELLAVVWIVLAYFNISLPGLA